MGEYINLEVIKEVWNKNIILSVSLNKSESPSPYYVVVSQHSYLPWCTKQIREHFKIITDQPAWFEFNGIPLQWHYPLGVLHDWLSPHSYPFNLTINFDNYPSEEILMCPEQSTVNSETVKTLFNDVYKQAIAAKYGDTNSISNLDSQESRALWGSFSRNDFTTFHNTNQKINKEKWKKIPIRILQTKKKKYFKLLLMFLIQTRILICLSSWKNIFLLKPIKQTKFKLIPTQQNSEPKRTQNMKLPFVE